MKPLRRLNWLAAAGILVAAVYPGMTSGSDALCVRLASVVPRSRTSAPIAVDVEFNWQGRGLLTGKLEMVFAEVTRHVGRYRSSELVLHPGKQSVRMLLPAMNVSQEGLPLDTYLRFVARDRSIDLGRWPLFAPLTGSRSLVVCSSEPWGAGNRRHTEMMTSLQLENFNPEPGKIARQSVMTFPLRLPPEELATSALGYCGYDIVFLAGEGFSLLRERQLRALKSWVQAGGSICVLPGGGLKSYHVQFLNALASQQGRSSFILNEFGRLATAQGQPGNGIVLFRSGLGRTVVVLKELNVDRDLGLPGWRQAVTFLWRVRADQAASIARTGSWQAEKPEPGRDERRSPYDAYLKPGFSVRPDEMIPRLVEFVMPGAVRPVPFWMLVAVLVLFLVLIGPVDYFVLGLLKRRRLTWVFFPLMSIAFTLFAVGLSEHYMGRADRAAALVFVDVDRDGHSLRQSRYQVVFAGREKDAVTQLKSALFSPIDYRKSVEGSSLSYWGRYREPVRTEVPWYDGRIPTDFTVTQKLQQWSPELYRTLRIKGTTPKIGFNWDRVDPRSFVDAPGRTALQAQLLAADRLDDKSSADSPSQFKRNIWLFHQSIHYEIMGYPLVLPLDFLRHTCVRPARGLFSVVYQISPTGGSNFEDLAVLDPTDHRQWLLVVVTQVGDDYLVCRRLYQLEE